MLYSKAGVALEGLVAQHLRAWIAYSRNESSLYYWRTKSGAEVDFVIYGPNGFTAIEVKSSSRVERGDVRSLRTFRTITRKPRPCLPWQVYDARLALTLRYHGLK